MRIIYLMPLAGLLFTACCEINVETQQTTRVNSAASRNPITTDSENQSSQRTQGKERTGVKQEVKSVSENSLGRDVTGAEK